MNSKIRNKEKLLSAGDRESRRIVLEVADRTLQKLDGYMRVKALMSLSGNLLRIGTRSWDLSKKKHIYVIGAGKACNHMALAVEEILKNRISAGVAIVKIYEKEHDRFTQIRVSVGGHPIPNEEGLKACESILDLVDKAESEDLFITLISGGSTALMCCPIDGITLEEKKRATDVLLKSGASITEINAVRRHLSKLNGGNLAKRIEARGAELIGIVIYDAGDFVYASETFEEPKDFFGTPIAIDNTTLEDARNTIYNYGLEKRMPESVLAYLQNCGPEGETPKTLHNATYFVLNSIPDSCLYAKQVTEEMGIPAMILTTSIEGESKEAGSILASIAREIQQYHRPIMPPCVVLCAGETTTQITDNSLIKGHGGPSQELVIGFALAAKDVRGACILSIDTEGTDGTTLAAGGITDSVTWESACRFQINLHQALREHSSYEALEKLETLVITGNTGTNLCDLNILYVPAL